MKSRILFFVSILLVLVLTIYILMFFSSSSSDHSLISKIPDQSFKNLNKDTIEIFEVGNEYRMILSEDQFGSIFVFLFHEDTLLTEYKLDPIIDDDVIWGLARKHEEYSLFIGYFLIDDIIRVNLLEDKKHKTELPLLSYRNKVFFYSLSDNVHSPIYLEGIDKEGRIHGNFSIN